MKKTWKIVFLLLCLAALPGGSLTAEAADEAAVTSAQSQGNASAASETGAQVGGGGRATSETDAQTGSSESGSAASETGAQVGGGGSGSAEGDPAAVSQRPSIEGQWVGDGEDWQYLLPDGKYLKNAWLQDGGYWYHFSSGGYMQRGVRRIDGEYYYLRESGVMATGWAYDEDEEAWYHCEEDGAMTRGWYQAGDAWYWFDSRGVMYNKGMRMVSGHKYYFFENGQLAANQYVKLDYYDENGLENRDHDIVIHGDRRPTEEEKQQITEAMAGIPRAWIRQFVEDGWEIMFYTDKSYFSAPRTEMGIYYVYYDTDVNYKKLKFCDPRGLSMAFGEYVAHASGYEETESTLMADFDQYLLDSGQAEPLPSYFDEKPEMLFASLFDAFCREEVRAEMRQVDPDLYERMKTLLKIDTKGQKPEEGEMLEMNDDPYIDSGGNGPANDEELKKNFGPAGEG